MNNTDNFESIQGGTGAVLVALTCYAVIQNAFVFYVITRTSVLKSIAGNLLLSQTACDIICEIMIIILGIPNIALQNDLYPDFVKIVLLSAARGLTGLTTNISAAICFNLYAAICHSSTHNHIVTQVRVNIFYAGCLFVNIVLVFTQIFPYNNHIKNPTGSNFLPNYSLERMWVWIVHDLVVYVVPATVAVFSFLQILMQSRRNGAHSTLNSRIYDQIKLSKIIMSLTIWIILNNAGVHILRAVKVGVVADRSMTMTIVDSLSILFMALTFLYHFAKLPMLAVLYKPFKETMRTFVFKIRNSVGTIPQDDMESHV